MRIILNEEEIVRAVEQYLHNEGYDADLSAQVDIVVKFDDDNSEVVTAEAII